MSKGKSEDGLKEEDLLKLWKGLFYCMWFSDKPLVQEELADNLSDIINVFQPSSIGVLFSKIFFVTMGREWFGIDRLRLDKFYMLTKKFLKHSMQYISAQEWNESFLKEISIFFKDALLDPKYPIGLKIFVTENILKILKDICSESEKMLPDDALCTLMKPFFLSLAHSSCKNVLSTTRENVMDSLLTIEIINNNSVQMKIPLEMFAKELCQIAAEKDVVTKNRKILFHYTDKYRQVWNERQSEPKAKKGKRKSKVDGQSDDSTINSDDASTRKKKKKKNQGDVNKHEETKDEKISNTEISNGLPEEKTTESGSNENKQPNIVKTKKKRAKNSANNQETTEKIEEVTTDLAQLDADQTITKSDKKKIKTKSGAVNKETNIVDEGESTEGMDGLHEANDKTVTKTSNKKSTTKKGKKKTNQPKKDESDSQIDATTSEDSQVEDEVRKVLKFDAAYVTTEESVANSEEPPSKVDMEDDVFVEELKEAVSSDATKSDDKPGKIDSDIINTDEVNDPKKTDSKKKRKERRATLPAKQLNGTTESLAKTKPKRTRKSLPGESSVPLTNDKLMENGHSDEPVLNLDTSEPKDTPVPKKSKRKSLRTEDAPKPFVEFLQTETPKAFARKKAASANSEPRTKREGLTAVKKASKTPKTDVKRSVRIDISQNKSIGHKELTFSPLPAFNPDVKPTKGVLKTPASKRKRSTASDFFFK